MSSTSAYVIAIKLAINMMPNTKQNANPQDSALGTIAIAEIRKPIMLKIMNDPVNGAALNVMGSPLLMT